MEVTTVVAGILFEDNQVLIAQRAGNDKLNGKWEFPGGKLQEGENMHQSSSKPYRLMAYIGKKISGTFQRYVHQDLQWIDIKELDHYDFFRGRQTSD